MNSKMFLEPDLKIISTLGLLFNESSVIMVINCYKAPIIRTQKPIKLYLFGPKARKKMSWFW